MALKDFLVHVNSSKHASGRLDLAIRLAQSCEGHLAGLYTSAEFYVPAYVAAQLPPDMLATQRDVLAEARKKAKAMFEERTGRAGMAAEWREAEGDAGELAALHARYADLTIVGQPDPDEALPEPELEVPERVVLGSGRPALVVPYAGRFASIGERVLVAWNASAQAARAVNDALPLLGRAKVVTVLVVNPAGDEESGHGQVPGADLALHLSRHGIKAEAAHVFAKDIEVGDVILSRAADLGADLIVMGAYGHARLREMVLGGATRSLLEHMTVPVLMSH